MISRLLKLAAGGAAAAVALPAAALAGGPAGVTVYAGPNLKAPPVRGGDALAYFPSAVTVHVGDSVTWRFRGFHTVTFTGPKHPYPSIVPAEEKQPATSDAAGQPFWWAGKLPLLTISPLAMLPQGGATISSPRQTASSGLLRIVTAGNKEPAPFTLRFTKAGTYRYQCAIHPGMHGVVRVLPQGAPAPTAAQVARQGQEQLLRTVADLRRLARTRPAAPLTVYVGAGDRSGAEVTAFFPSALHVQVGQTVRFVNDDGADIHTVTFGPEALRSRIEQDFVAPHGKQVLLDPLGALPSDPPGAPVQYDGTNHGNGYLSSGVLQPKGAPKAAGPESFAVTFTKPGTFHYECVVHPHMDGTVVVG